MTRAARPIVLDHRVDLYIPSQCVCTGGLPEKLRAGAIEEVKSKFDNWFGGHAEIQIKGDSRLPDGTIAKEDVSDTIADRIGADCGHVLDLPEGRRRYTVLSSFTRKAMDRRRLAAPGGGRHQS